jgi:CheY-like chemotaxis protein/GGDEF domain-containing protein
MSRFGRPRKSSLDDPTTPVLRVLLIDDDDDEQVITRDLLARIPGTRYELDWAQTFEVGLERLETDGYDVALVDYRLGAETGVELVREAMRRGIRTPLVLLTGDGGREADTGAATAGATDYLVKGRTDAAQLERSLRYAIANARSLEQVRRSRDLIAAVEELGSMLGMADDRGDLLDDVAELLTTRFGFRYLSIYLLDGTALWLAAQRGYAAPVRVFDVASGPIPSILASHRPTLVPNITVDAEHRTADVPHMELCVPIADRQPLGLLNVGSEPGAPLGEADTHVLIAIADRLAAAIALGRERKAVAERATELHWLRIEAAAGGVHDPVSGLYTNDYAVASVGQWLARPAWGPEITPVTISVALLEAQVAEAHADVALKHLAELAMARIGGGDIATRHGSRQMAIALHGGSSQDASDLASSIVRAAAERWSLPVVAGCAALSADAPDAEMLFHGVDAALFLAHQMGQAVVTV